MQTQILQADDARCGYKCFGRDGLLGVYLSHVLHVEAEEIYRLAGSVYLSLIDVLALPYHRCRIDDVAIRTTEQIGSLEKDGSRCSQSSSAHLVRARERRQWLAAHGFYHPGYNWQWYDDGREGEPSVPFSPFAPPSHRYTWYIHDFTAHFLNGCF